MKPYAWRVLSEVEFDCARLISSINASYTVQVIQSIMSETDLKSFKAKKTTMGFIITGEKSSKTS
jgi:hypothetical protein